MTDKGEKARSLVESMKAIEDNKGTAYEGIPLACEMLLLVSRPTKYYWLSLELVESFKRICAEDSDNLTSWKIRKSAEKQSLELTIAYLEDRLKGLTDDPDG